MERPTNAWFIPFLSSFHRNLNYSSSLKLWLNGTNPNEKKEPSKSDQLILARVLFSFTTHDLYSNSIYNQ